MKKRFLLSILGLLGCFLFSEAVTLNVRVPEGTKVVYVAGSFNGWSTSSHQMDKKDATHFSIDLPGCSESDINAGYKYLSGPDWKYVEKDATGGEISNRTKMSEEDVVARWANLYNTDIIQKQIKVNGYERKLRIALPTDYASSSKSYPVVYMVGVQQRFSDAGSDSDAGDDFFGENSWNASATAERLQEAGQNGCIMVAMYGFVAENIPYPYPSLQGVEPQTNLWRISLM